MKKNIYAIIDTETAGNFEVPRIYDIGVLICDKQGTTIFARQWIIKEVFGNKRKMNSAYYAEKIPLYEMMLETEPYLLSTFKDMKAELNQILQAYEVNYLVGYNLQFDLGALKYTNYKYDYPKHGWELCKIFNKEYQYIDLWGFACQTLGNQKAYKKFVDTHGLLTEKGNRKSSAEVMFAYISNNPTFVENHISLDDCYIEKDIMVKCFQQKKKIPRNCFIAHPWRLVQG